jgi:hypothetical protein
MRSEEDTHKALECLRYIYNTTVGIDETLLAYYYNKQVMRWLINFGRHNGLDVYIVARRFYELRPEIRAQAETVYILKVTEPTDAEAIYKWWGVKPDKLRSFRPGEYVKVGK